MSRVERKGNQARMQTIYTEIALHQRRLGFTSDELPHILERTIPRISSPDDEQRRRVGVSPLQKFMLQMKDILPLRMTNSGTGEAI